MPLIRRVPKRGFTQPVPGRVRGGQRRRSSRTSGATVDAGAAGRARAGPPRAAGQGPGRRRAEARPSPSSAHKFSAVGARQDRGRRRTLRGARFVIESFRNIFAIPDLRKRVLFTFGAAGGLPDRLPHPDAGSRSAGAARVHERGCRARFLGLREHVHRRQPRAGGGLRAGHHAVHHGVDHPAAADGGRARTSRSCRRKASSAGARSPSTRATARSWSRSSSRSASRSSSRRPPTPGGRAAGARLRAGASA